MKLTDETIEQMRKAAEQYAYARLDEWGDKKERGMRVDSDVVTIDGFTISGPKMGCWHRDKVKKAFDIEGWTIIVAI